MNNNLHNSAYSEDNGYVNIHGQDVRAFQCDKTGRILIPIDELRNMGFRLYRKSQYSKLLIDDAQFGKEFELYMLQSAQTYMLEHRIAFKENDILESINKCKLLLSGGQNAGGQNLNKTPDNFTKTHMVATNSNHDITISTPNDSRNVQNVNKFRGFTQNRSPKASTVTEIPTLRSPRSSINDDKQSDHGSDIEKSFKNRNNNRVSVERNNSDVRSKLRDRLDVQPKRDFEIPEEKLTSVELDNGEHTMIVTHIEKSAVWAQDVSRADDLVDIDRQIKEHVAKNPPKVSKFIYNKLYLGCQEGEWYRCKVIKFKPPTVFFVDYGNSMEVSELIEVTGPLAKIPGQCVRLVFNSQQNKREVYETVTVKVSRKTDGGSYFVDVIDSPEPSVPVSVVPSTPTFNVKPQPLCKLENNQRVMIISHVDGKIALRTRESYDKLKQIEEAIDKRELKPVDGVVKGQIVICKEEKAQRAVVTNVNGNTVELESLDYYENKKTNLSHVFHIDESLATQPLTYVLTPQIKGYTEDSAQIIQELGNRKAKATVVMNNGDFDLNLGDGLLSAKLQPKGDRPMLESFKRFKPNLGVGEYLLNTYRSPSEVYFCSEEVLVEHLDAIIKSELPNDPYEPIKNEVCFGLYQSDWSRCVVRRVMTSRYEVEFVDFGNLEVLNSEQLRKLTDDAKAAPILGIHCQLIGLPYVKDVEEALKGVMTESQTFEVDVKRAQDGVYEIEIPSIYEQLRGH